MSTSPLRKPAIIESGSPYHLNTSESRWAGLPVFQLRVVLVAGEAQLGARRHRSNLNAPLVGILATSSGRKPWPLTWSATGILDR